MYFFAELNLKLLRALRHFPLSLYRLFVPTFEPVLFEKYIFSKYEVPLIFFVRNNVRKDERETTWTVISRALQSLVVTSQWRHDVIYFNIENHGIFKFITITLWSYYYQIYKLKYIFCSDFIWKSKHVSSKRINISIHYIQNTLNFILYIIIQYFKYHKLTILL